jgi:hypothetical protein
VRTPRLKTNSFGASTGGWSAANARTQLRQWAEQYEPSPLLPVSVCSALWSSSARQKEQLSFGAFGEVRTARTVGSIGACVNERTSVTMVAFLFRFASPRNERR